MQTKHKTVYQTVIRAPLEKVWQGLTAPRMVRQYFFGTDLVTDWKAGSPIIFQGEWEGTSYQDKGTILEYRPNDFLSYSYLSNWSGLPDQPENYLIVTYEVKKVEGGTGLTITQTNYDEEKARHSEGNWGMIIDGLRKLIE